MKRQAQPDIATRGYFPLCLLLDPSRASFHKFRPCLGLKMKSPKLHSRSSRPSHSKLWILFTLISFIGAAVLPLASSPRSVRAASESVRSGNAGKTSIGRYSVNASHRALPPAQMNFGHVLPASYYSLRGNLSATLTLNNKGPQPLDVQPAIFSLNGQRLDVPPVTVPGTSFRVIDLRQWAVPGAGFDEGSLQIVHYGMDMQLGAQVRVIDADHSLIFAEQLMQVMAMSSRLEGVWWLRSPKSKCASWYPTPAIQHFLPQ